jgi:hypothetical protein
MKIAVVTSMHEPYFQGLGRICINSFKKYWPADSHMYLYNEGFTIPNTDNVTCMGFNLGPDYDKFVSSTNYKSRVNQFAKKAFSWIHAFENIKCDRLIWIDADCRTLKPPDIDLLLKMCPDDKLSAHMGIWYTDAKDPKHGMIKIDPVYSVETGFYIFNPQHKQATEFVNTYRNYYLNRFSDKMRRFYDGDVYGCTVKDFDDKLFYDFNPKNSKTALGRSELKQYFLHLKGKVKKEKK